MDDIRIKAVLEILWDVSEKVGLRAEDETKEHFIEEGMNKVTTCEEDKKFILMLDEFGKARTAELVAEYERRIEALEGHSRAR